MEERLPAPCPPYSISRSSARAESGSQVGARKCVPPITGWSTGGASISTPATPRADPPCEASGSPHCLPAGLAQAFSPPHSGNLVLLLPHTTPIYTSKPGLLPLPLSGMFCQVFAWPASSWGSGLHTNITSSEKRLTIPHAILFHIFV